MHEDCGKYVDAFVDFTNKAWGARIEVSIARLRWVNQVFSCISSHVPTVEKTSYDRSLKMLGEVIENFEKAGDFASMASTPVGEVPAGQLARVVGIDPREPAKGAHLPMIPSSWRFGFWTANGELQFRRLDEGAFVIWDAVKDAVFASMAKPGDWPEDFGHENGQYLCSCVHCERVFTGHKRRVVCKLCDASPAPAASKGAEAADPCPLLDSEGRAMIVNSPHYTPASILALIEQFRKFADPQRSTLEDWESLDWRGFCNIAARVMAALYDELPATAPSEPEAQKAVAVGGFFVMPDSARPVYRFHLQIGGSIWRYVKEDDAAPSPAASEVRGLTEPSYEQWYDIASAHATKDWNGPDFLELVKSVGRAARAIK